MLRQTHYSTSRTIEKLQIIHNIHMQWVGIEQNNIQHLQIEEKLQNLHETILFILLHLMMQIHIQHLQCTDGWRKHPQFHQIHHRYDGCEEIKIHLQQQIDGVQNGKQNQMQHQIGILYIDDEQRNGLKMWMCDMFHQHLLLIWWLLHSIEKQ